MPGRRYKGTVISENPFVRLLNEYGPDRRRGLSEADIAQADQYLLEALSNNKRDGLLLAVRAR